MKIAIGAGAFLAGMGVIWGLQNTLLPPQIPNGYYDLSSMPDEFERKFENPGTFDFIRLAYDNEMERQKSVWFEEREIRQLRALPSDVPPFPNGKDLFNVLEGTDWPELEDSAVQAALDEAKGEWVVLNYWASWCGPCLKELPDMNAAVEPLQKRGVRLIAINTDIYKRDTRESAEALFEKRGIDKLPGLFVDGDAMEQALAAGGMPPGGNREFPTNIIFAPGGKPYAYFRGIPIGEYDGAPFWASDEMLSFFEALVASDVT